MKKKTKNRAVWIVVAALVVAGFWLLFNSGDSKEAEAKIISRNGLHWHATLKISIDGKPVEIPAAVGLGAVHNPIHTHEADEVIHLEFNGLVSESNITLEKFFDVWSERFSSDCILDKCVTPENGKAITMTVNSVPSTEFENYVIQDGDKIEIKYE